MSTILATDRTAGLVLDGQHCFTLRQHTSSSNLMRCTGPINRRLALGRQHAEVDTGAHWRVRCPHHTGHNQIDTRPDEGAGSRGALRISC
jgi:hypothetical protein